MNDDNFKKKNKITADDEEENIATSKGKIGWFCLQAIREWVAKQRGQNGWMMLAQSSKQNAAPSSVRPPNTFAFATPMK